MSLVLIRSLYDLGVRHNLRSPFIDVDGEIFLLEVSGRKPALSRTKCQISMPFPAGRGANGDLVPWRMWDSAKYVLRTLNKTKSCPNGKLLGEAFWKQACEDAEAAGLGEIAEAIGRTEKFVLTSVKSISGKESIDCMGVEKIALKSNIALTYEGKIIAMLPKFRKYWMKLYEKSATASAESSTHLDVVTGEPCQPVNTHAQVSGFPGTGGKAPLASFKFEAYGYGGRYWEAGNGGENFPISEKTNQTYTAALRYLVENSLASFGGMYGIACWSEVDKEHAVIPLVRQVFGTILKTEEADKLWADVEALSSEDDTPISALLVCGASKARISVLNSGTFSAGTLRDALLRFHREFAQMRKNVTFPAVACFHRAQGETENIFDGLVLSEIAWSVLTGSKYPAAMLSDLDLNNLVLIPEENLPHGTLSVAVAWECAYYDRIGKKAEKEDNVMQSSDQATEVLNKMLEQIPEDLRNVAERMRLSSDDSDDAAFRYGMMVSLFEYLAVNYHGSKKVMRRDVTLGQATNPQQFINENYPDAPMYGDAFARKGYRDAKIVEALFRAAFGSLSEWARSRKRLKRHEQTQYFFGYHFADVWNAKFLNWHFEKNKVAA